MSLLYSSESPSSSSLCLNDSTTECLPCVISNITSFPASFYGTMPVSEDPRIEVLRRYSYGFALPSICLLGIIGNVFNLVVLTRRNMRGTAYIYMRVRYTGGSFLYGEPCNEINTAQLRVQNWEVPITTKCVDVKGFKKNMLAKMNLSSYAEFFNQVEKAHTLYSDHMNLTRFPISIVRKLPNLEFIDLSGNLLARIPNKVFLIAPKLNKLFLSDNEVIIPKKRPFLSSLTLGTLMLSNNGISAIYKYTFMKLPALEVLYLDDNNLRSISPSMFHSLPNLKYLHLGRNYLTNIPPKWMVSKSLMYYITKSQNTVDLK
ncbi:unnamed protein product [Phaedon cochleariae]|uniref:Uncharacterized protein n=1 Tax=Phaedon cochleariae TaxID=80249 RepID=A0A9N9SJR0_PHACE|nr:unnamed protein product [Phaedon cochleariae]